MSIHNDFVLPVPEALIDQLADRVADKVIDRLRPILEKPAVIPAKPVKPQPDRPLPTFLRLRALAERDILFGLVHERSARVDRRPERIFARDIGHVRVVGAYFRPHR